MAAKKKTVTGKAGSSHKTARSKTTVRSTGKIATGSRAQKATAAGSTKTKSHERPRDRSERPANDSQPALTEARLLKMPARDYMNETQLAFFRRRLLEMRAEAEERLQAARERLHQHETAADEADRASLEEERWLELRLRERESVLINKINQALKKIARHEYGYCEVTGEAIGLPRLLARPTATVCVDVKRDDEQRETHFLQ